MASHCINPCDRCGADLGEDGGTICELCRLGLEYRDALATEPPDGWDDPTVEPTTTDAF